MHGNALFIIKLQDSDAMPIEQADRITSLITDLDPYLPKVQRGAQAATLNGYMKCALDRHSCSGGDFGLTKAEREDPWVANQVMCIVREQVRALQRAFPCVMTDMYQR